MTALGEAQQALDSGDWARALELLDGPAGDSDEGLQLRAAAAYGFGDLDLTLASWETLYARRSAVADRSGAAWAASMVALYLLIDTGLMSLVRGWLGRAQRLLDDSDNEPAAAIEAMVRGYERLFCGDAQGTVEHASRAVELGERLEVPAALVVGRTALARVKILTGDVEGGLAELDEVAALLMSGAADPLTAGMMYCEVICAAQSLSLHDRAREWTEAMERWRHGAAFGALHGRCRVHRAELLRLSGPGAAAEAEALGACEDLRPWLRREYGWPLVELGNIRLRRGDLAGAEQAFLDAHRHVWSPQPGLSLLRLAQGHLEVAAAMISEAVTHPFETPSKEQPPFGDLRLAPLLSAQAEIAAAAGDAPVARLAADQLTAVAAGYPSEVLAASAALARARVALLEDDHSAAAAEAERALAAWSEAGAPYEAAQARVVLGTAYRSAGRTERARMEWMAARSAFEAYGAELEVARVSGLLDTQEAPAPSATHTDVVTFALVGGCRRIRYAGTEAVLPDMKGFRYLERLLAEPGRELHVLDLIAGEGGGALTEAGYPALDEEARAAYQRRLVEVEEDIDDATEQQDLGRLELARRDREYLLAELSQAVGLGGRIRTTGGSAERARVSVTRAVRYAIKRLSEHAPDLGEHLARCTRTGVFCAYLPDPVAAIRWDLRGDGESTAGV